MNKKAVVSIAVIVSVLFADIVNYTASIKANGEEAAVYTRSAAINGEESEKNYVPGEIIVKYKTNVNMTVKSNSLNRKYSFKVKDRFKAFNGEVIKLPATVSVNEAINRLKGDSSIELVQPNFRYRPTTIYSNRLLSAEASSSKQWGLYNYGQSILGSNGISGVDIDIRNAWGITMGKDNVVVAILDTGIDINHPELKDSIWVNEGEIPGNNIDDDNNGYIDDINGWDFFNNDNTVFDYEDGEDHGTSVAGIIAAASNSIGTVGVAPKVKIMPLKFLGPDYGTTEAAIKAIEYAKNKGIKILNNSWGGGEYDRALDTAIKEANALFVVAAGNDGINNDFINSYPANSKLPNVVTVAAVNNKGSLAWFSNYGGATVHLAAPGADIFSTIPGIKYSDGSVHYENAYQYYSGTSMAVPFVSGTAALLVSRGVDDPIIIKNKMIASVNPLSGLKDKIITGGVVNAYKTLGGYEGRLDADESGQVGVSDLSLLSEHYNTILEEQNWNSHYDINEDGILDLLDLVEVSRFIN
jgi:subtilisin family serine protease